MNRAQRLIEKLDSSTLTKQIKSELNNIKLRLNRFMDDNVEVLLKDENKQLNKKLNSFYGALQGALSSIERVK